jgi:hypothetical protein
MAERRTIPVLRAMNLSLNQPGGRIMEKNTNGIKIMMLSRSAKI